ncbi:MAG: TIGR04086 family membrane protein [Ruminococcaceae bacterium]|nr:TIGR04086 family membrane protein [Oscillospiraceae bacterium]
MQKQDYSVVDIRSSHTHRIIHIAKSIAIALLFTILVFVIFALLITYTNVPETAVSTVVLLTTLFSVMLSGMLVSGRATNRGWFHGAVAGLCYMLMVYLAGAILFTGPVFDRRVVWMILIGFLAGAFGGIIGINLKKR